MFKVNNKYTRTPCSSISIVNFEQVNAGWVVINQMDNTDIFEIRNLIRQQFPRSLTPFLFKAKLERS